MVDVAVAIDFEATTVVRRRFPGGSYTPGGAWVKGVLEDFEFQAEVQPTNARQLMDLPEGVRAEARYLLWTRLEDLYLDDNVIYEGDEYRVVFKWNRQRSGNYTRCALGMVKPDGNRVYP